jgi:tRNA dimethylallyltransferase
MKVVPVILGPTGIGKTEISLHIADKIPLEIISADSRQIYRLLDIGTAKPATEILQKIPHHFINHLDPSEYYSAGMFGRDARTVISHIIGCGNMPLVVGGSGFYIQALIDGLSEIEVPDQKVRKSLRKRLETEGIGNLYDELGTVDPELAKRLELKDKQRILRGLEVYHTFKRPLSELQLQKPLPAAFESIQIGINAERQYLYERINKRVDHMIKEGLVEEVSRLRSLGYSEKDNALNTVGYKEVFEHLNGDLDFETMVEKIKMNSRRYAKRQLTWFKKDKRICWYQLDMSIGAKEIANQIIEKLL